MGVARSVPASTLIHYYYWTQQPRDSLASGFSLLGPMLCTLSWSKMKERKRQSMCVCGEPAIFSSSGHDMFPVNLSPSFLDLDWTARFVDVDSSPASSRQQLKANKGDARTCTFVQGLSPGVRGRQTCCMPIRWRPRMMHARSTICHCI
jgi:hypothetical protein